MLALLLCGTSVKSQTRAVTELGDTIYVYNNGTWSFEIQEEAPVVNEFDFLNQILDIDTIQKPYSYPANAKKQVKSERNQFAVKYNDKIWKRIPPATLNEEAEIAFQAKHTDIWCVIITEVTPIDADKLFKIAKKMMEENTGGIAKIKKTEVRTVNENQIFYGKLETDFSGINFIFNSYYFSNEKGSVQFVTWTSSTLHELNKDLIQDLLNGFVVLDQPS
ncbi:hypothetical protein ELS83_16405 [Marinifilum sp. JC070]|uniref:Uncharacterized protein n=2 Tax=Marinifilum caeruleilacunae TaxID=2499076 RepID=A0ABX1WZ50_9BACT|nr:hypothetical protein [Marinifilum caeruleilacunae]